MNRKFIIILFFLAFVACDKAKDSLPQYKPTITNSIGMNLNYIPPGTFMMGPKDEYRFGGPGEITDQHKVTLTKGFYIQIKETTIGQWKKFINKTRYQTESEKRKYSIFETFSQTKEIKGLYWDNPGYEKNDNYPVTMVTWEDTQQFIKWLNMNEKGDRYRLPTEAEWEYACRAGTNQNFFYGNLTKKDNIIIVDSGANPILNEYAWYNENSNGFPHEVGLKKANSWGLYDMLGNVSEFCYDYYRDKFSNFEKDPIFLKRSIGRVERGGSWYTRPILTTCSTRNWVEASYSSNFYGFRVVKELDDGDLIKQNKVKK